MAKETLGEIFKRYRRQESADLDKIAQQTKISKHLLVALENNDYQVLPDNVYTRNIIKTYAQYLSLDYQKLLLLYEQEQKSSVTNKGVQVNGPLKVYLTPQRLRNILIAVVIIGIIVYLSWQINQIFKAPQLVVWQPDKDLIINQNYLEIKGSSEKEARIFINGKEVFMNSKEEFSATVDLHQGINIIKIEASKKRSKANVIYRQVLVQ